MRESESERASERVRVSVSVSVRVRVRARARVRVGARVRVRVGVRGSVRVTAGERVPRGGADVRAVALLRVGAPPLDGPFGRAGRGNTHLHAIGQSPAVSQHRGFSVNCLHVTKLLTPNEF